VKTDQQLISIVMGSSSDWGSLQHTSDLLDLLKIEHEVEVVSAHRTPDKLFAFAENAKSRGIEVIIAGAGGAAHLPGMLAAKTLLPIIGVPIQSKMLNGIDSLLSIVQMPAGIPVATMAIGDAGAKNAALFAAAILAARYPNIEKALEHYRAEQTRLVLQNPDPRESHS
jgi:5-(carboxyamino)imidazole ribonucleotide mutase